MDTLSGSGTLTHSYTDPLTVSVATTTAAARSTVSLQTQVCPAAAHWP